MREPTFLILTALAGAARYGYEIAQEVRALSDGRVKLLTGTLYTALDRLVAERLIEPDREELVDGRVRRYYRLTSDGLAALSSETARLRNLATAAEERLRSVPKPSAARPSVPKRSDQKPSARQRPAPSGGMVARPEPAS